MITATLALAVLFALYHLIEGSSEGNTVEVLYAALLLAASIGSFVKLYA